MNEYRFNAIDHIHEIFENGSYKPLVGCSSLSSLISKGGLVYWASGLAVEKFGWTHKGNKEKGWTKKEDRLEKAIKRRKEIAELDDESYLQLLDDAYAAHSQKLAASAEDGTNLHERMEKYVKLCMEKNDGKPIAGDTEHQALQIFVSWSLSNVRRFLWSEVNCYSRDLWLGGISDCGYEDMEGNYAILDFKSSKEAYLSQFWQCVAYAILLEENGGVTPDGDKVFTLSKEIHHVSVLPFGMKEPTVSHYYDMVGGKEAVKAMVTLYRKVNNYERG